MIETVDRQARPIVHPEPNTDFLPLSQWKKESVVNGISAFVRSLRAWTVFKLTSKFQFQTKHKVKVYDVKFTVLDTSLRTCCQLTMRAHTTSLTHYLNIGLVRINSKTTEISMERKTSDISGNWQDRIMMTSSQTSYKY
jgi:hypothetical protein